MELTEETLESIVQRVLDEVIERQSVVDDRYVDTDEASQYLGLTKQRIYHLTSLGRIPVHKIGKSNRFRKSELDAWVKQGGNIA